MEYSLLYFKGLSIVLGITLICFVVWVCALLNSIQNWKKKHARQEQLTTQSANEIKTLTLNCEFFEKESKSNRELAETYSNRLVFIADNIDNISPELVKRIGEDTSTRPLNSLVGEHTMEYKGLSER
ncbi:hypothetical protein CZP2022_289 [Vibrio phage C-ZP2022]|nr:hypothetical protein CZP2022_289 [Vibrio phage C-ZP2022]